MYNPLSIVLVIAVIYLYLQIKKEQKRNRILQSFVAGNTSMLGRLLLKVNDLERIQKGEESELTSNIIYHKLILPEIDAYFKVDFWVKPYDKWLKNDRNIFYDDKYRNVGFNTIYLDFVDMNIAEFKKTQEEENREGKSRL